MTAVLCSPLISRKPSHTASLLFLLLLTEPTSNLVHGAGKARAKLEGRLRTEGRVRAGVKDVGGHKTSFGRNGETGFGVARLYGSDAVAGGDGEAQADPNAAGFGPTLSMDEGGLREPHSSSRCVPIPPSMALCQKIGYDAMRMPNLLGHESPAEAVQQSASWLPLLARECHPDARIFLCSLFAPICLERFISPCKSLCESVRDSCAPVMRCFGYPWPEILHCDQYPADHLMCISSMTNTTAHKGGHAVPRASCRDCELEVSSTSKDTLESFCRSDFVVKLRLKRLKYSPASLAQFSLAPKLKVLKHGPLLGGQIRSRIELWLERDATCVRNMTRHHPRGGTFLVTGTVQGEHLVVSKAYNWQRRDKNLTAAARKWKNHRCRS